MGVGIEYLGRWGNHVFQYSCGRIFSEENNLKLKATPPKGGIFDVLPWQGGQEFVTPATTLDDFSGVLDRPYPPGNYLLRGFFQQASWYLSRRKKIFGFMRPRRSQFERNTRDIAIHLRLGDFKVMKWCIHPDWYLSILKKESFRRLHIFTDEIDQSYINAFSKYDPKVVCGNPEEDWQLLRSFDRIAISMSTYAWWAAFFGKTKKLYMFKRYPFGAGMTDIPGSTVVDGPLLHEREAGC